MIFNLAVCSVVTEWPSNITVSWFSNGLGLPSLRPLSKHSLWETFVCLIHGLLYYRDQRWHSWAHEAGVSCHDTYTAHVCGLVCLFVPLWKQGHHTTGGRGNDGGSNVGWEMTKSKKPSKKWQPFLILLQVCALKHGGVQRGRDTYRKGALIDDSAEVLG